MAFCFYRYHVPDPVFFRRDIRVTMQQIGYWNPEIREAFRASGVKAEMAGPACREIDFAADGGVPDYGNFEREDDWSSCAYFYLDRPRSELPELDPVEKRIEGLDG